jgi:two-component system KDP operon response regulator KdpE
VTRAAKILLVDDEVALQRALVPLLASRGYDVRAAGTGAQALAAFDTWAPDLVVLDLGLPDLDGTDVCRRIRASAEAPIIVLSARGAEADKVAALDLGADDYVTKPFGSEELVARIRTALRRAFRREDREIGQLQTGDLLIDFDRHRVIRSGEDIRLTPKEFDLLSILARNAGRVLTHRKLLAAIWGEHAANQPEHLWVLIRQLRKKIERNPSEPRYLLSEPWIGYRFAGSDAEPSPD